LAPGGVRGGRRRSRAPRAPRGPRVATRASNWRPPRRADRGLFGGVWGTALCEAMPAVPPGVRPWAVLTPQGTPWRGHASATPAARRRPLQRRAVCVHLRAACEASACALSGPPAVAGALRGPPAVAGGPSAAQCDMGYRGAWCAPGRHGVLWAVAAWRAGVRSLRRSDALLYPSITESVWRVS